LRRGFRLRRYDSGTQILIVTLPNDLHEELHLNLYARFYKQLVRDGTDEDWRQIGNATRRVQGHPGGDGGEGDSTGGPKPARQGPGNWPTLVIEAGDSETLNQLHADMRWWFSASNHDVQIVLLAKFDHRRSQIILEKWEEEWSQYSGPTTRSRSVMMPQAGRLVPIRRQYITISRSADLSYHVTRGALVLGFRLLFLRNPGPHEHDFVISVAELQRYAECVWQQVRE
jgi:hypothetical protein